jgi:hypothetical protein
VGKYVDLAHRSSGWAAHQARTEDSTCQAGLERKARLTADALFVVDGVRTVEDDLPAFFARGESGTVHMGVRRLGTKRLTNSSKFSCRHACAGFVVASTSKAVSVPDTVPPF